MVQLIHFVGCFKSLVKLCNHSLDICNQVCEMCQPDRGIVLVRFSNLLLSVVIWE